MWKLAVERVRKEPLPGEEFDAVAVGRALIAEVRPKQWVKNLACLAGLIFSGRLFLLVEVAHGLLAFAAFCAASSAVYLLNDFVDREKDRKNPRTASRPLASGALPLWAAGFAFARTSSNRSMTWALCACEASAAERTHGIIRAIGEPRRKIFSIASSASTRTYSPRSSAR